MSKIKELKDRISEKAPQMKGNKDKESVSRHLSGAMNSLKSMSNPDNRDKVKKAVKAIEKAIKEVDSIL